MAQTAFISSVNRRSPRKDWNEYQHLATQGRFIEPKVFSGFQNPCIRLTSVKRQLYNQKLPSMRQVEHDEALHRLANEHCRHTTRSTDEQFQSLDPRREASFIEFSGLVSVDTRDENWDNTGKSLMGMNSSTSTNFDSSLEFGARLRPDKSSTKLHRNSQFYPHSRSSLKTAEGVFRSSSMHIWNPSDNTNYSKSTQV